MFPGQQKNKAPFRPSRSAKAYAEVWTEEGSPLLVNSERLTEAVTEQMGQGWKVVLGMRYGQPAMSEALKQLVDAGVDRIAVGAITHSAVQVDFGLDLK